MNYLIKVSSNWSRVGGCSYAQCVQELPADPDLFLKPDVNNLVDKEKSILLSKEQSSDYCELYINRFPHYKIQSISFVCDAAKVEIFQGPIMEYIETVYGVVVDQTDDQFQSYRYDVETKKSGVTYLTLRFLTNSSEVCIFGLLLYTSPNPNGITSLLPFNHSINTPNASAVEVPERLLQIGVNAPQLNSVKLGPHFEEKLDVANDERSEASKGLNEDMLNNLKFHIDTRFEEMTMHVNSKLSEMEKRQNEKLDKLLYILKNK